MSDKESNGQWHGGKGSVQKDHDHDKYAENYDKIFKKDKNKEEDWDMLPDVEDLEKIVERELKKLEDNDGDT